MGSLERKILMVMTLIHQKDKYETHQYSIAEFYRQNKTKEGQHAEI